MQVEAVRKAFRDGEKHCPNCGLAYMYHSGVVGGLACMFPNGKVRWPSISGGYIDELGRYHKTNQ